MHMQNSFKNVDFLNKATNNGYGSFLKQKPMTPFSIEVTNYLDALSKEINRDLRIRKFPDVRTFSFFCRKANLLLLEKQQKEF